MKAAKRAHRSTPATPKPKVPAESAATPKRQAPFPFQGSFPSLAFFVVYGLCLWKWIDVGLIYHGSGWVQDFPSFYWGWDFVQDFRTHPGGFVEYGSALLAQSMYSSWFGALILTLQAALIYACLANAMRRCEASRKVRLLAFLPPLLLLAIYCKYRHYSAATTSFAIGALCIWAWLRFGPAKRVWQLGLALVVAGFLYAGAPSALFVFVPSVLLWALVSGAGWLPALVWFGLMAILPPLLGAVLFGFASREAYAKVLPLAWDPIVLKLAGIYFVIGLYILPLLFCLSAAVWRLSRRHGETSGQEARTETAPTPVRANLMPGNIWKWVTVGAAVLPLVTVGLTLKPQVRALMYADYYVWHGQWAQALAACQGNSPSAYVACTAAQACYHLGTLTQQLPDMATPADLLLSNDKQQAHWKQSDIYFDLGYVNMALHHLTESLEFYGERPVLLQRLALVNLALTNTSTASVYLGTLAHAPFQGSWARGYFELLKIDPTLTGDAEINRLRRLMVRSDSVVALGPDEELLMLLGANRQNRMAFEYLMTYYLLSKNLEGFVRQLPRIRDFPDLRISPLWDEALELAGRLAGRRMQIPGHTLSPEATTRVETVTRLVREYGEKTDLARKKLAPEYGHTYTFYWWFHE